MGRFSDGGIYLVDGTTSLRVLSSEDKRRNAGLSLAFSVVFSDFSTTATHISQLLALASVNRFVERRFAIG